jgi:peptide-methionine (S)-S-oxide reductase
MSAGKRRLTGGLLVVLTLAGIQAMWNSQESGQAAGAQPSAPPRDESVGRLEKATFGAGCFWCVEAVFQRLKGVQSVVSGYSGGQVKNPTYKQVCTGRTGHAEVVQITFDPNQVSYPELLEVFWGTHNPTTRNRQGNDKGPQYRSAIFYHSDEQKKQAEHYKQKLDESGAFRTPIVTEIVAFREFFPAEDYHQNYYNLNSRQPYCQLIIQPKVEKLKKVFGDRLKDPAKASAGGVKQ